MGLWFALICWGSCIGWFTSRFVWVYGGLLLRVVVSCVVWVGRAGLGGVAVLHGFAGFVCC